MVVLPDVVVNRFSSSALFGNLFENMAGALALKARALARRDGGWFLYRDSSGVEVDLGLGAKPYPRAFEMKAPMTHQPESTKNLAKFSALIGSDEPGRLSYSGEIRAEGDKADRSIIASAPKKIRGRSIRQEVRE